MMDKTYVEDTAFLWHCPLRHQALSRDKLINKAVLVFKRGSGFRLKKVHSQNYRPSAKPSYS